MKYPLNFVLISLAIALAACESGGDHQVPPVTSPSPTSPVGVLPGGIWYGTLKYTYSAPEDALALVTEDVRFRYLPTRSDVDLVGNFAIRQTPFQAGGTYYAAASGDPAYPDAYAYRVNFWGNIDERGTMSVTWASTWDSSGDLEFYYDADLYERSSSLEYLAGTWTGYDESGNPSLAMTINADGRFSGQNTQDCSSSGQFALIDGDYNLYEARDLLTDCDSADSSYSGFAFLFDVNGAASAGLYVSADDGLQPLRIDIRRN